MTLPNLNGLTVNFHINRACNYRCSFCYAHFNEHSPVARPTISDWSRMIDAFADAGIRKINFAGGEPTLHRDLATMILHAKQRGLITSIVTNGARLSPLIHKVGGYLDLVGLSIDSAEEATNAALGRGTGEHVRITRQHAYLVHESAIRLKINTVVTRLNHHEDMSGLIRELSPERWKLLQMLPIAGENDQSIANLSITGHEFDAFVHRHRPLEESRGRIIPEHNDAMTGSYVMVDPDGRLFDNVDGRLSYSSPIHRVGLVAAWSEVRFNERRFAERGGHYE